MATLTQKEKKEGKVERILPGNLLALREIDDSPNIAIARLLEENKQMKAQITDLRQGGGQGGQAIDYQKIGDVLDERLKTPFDVLSRKSSNAEEIGNIVESRLNKILEPFIEK